MGGRPLSDGPDTIEELMRNTRNNPLEDLGMHLPLICDRYEVRDDVPPGAGKFRGGVGVVKSQRYLTPGFMTHESDRNEDAPWGIFGGKRRHGRQGRLQRRPSGEVREMPAKFSGLAVEANDVMTYYSPNGGGYGKPLERPARKVLDDVLDGFYTVEHAREVYGVVVDVEAETVDIAATEALRARMSA